MTHTYVRRAFGYRPLQSQARARVASILTVTVLTAMLWFVTAIINVAHAADCSSGDFSGVYETNDVTLFRRFICDQ